MSEAWKQAVVEETARLWGDGQMAFLLSNIPPFLERHGFNVADIKGKASIRELLKRELDGELTLLSNDSDPLVWGVVPANATITDPNSVHFSTHSAPKTRSSERYLSPVWTAFSRPAEFDYERYLVTEPRVEFFDLKPDAGPFAGGIHIPRKFQIGDGVPIAERAARIVENIVAWANENCIAHEVLTKAGKVSSPSLVVPEHSLLANLVAVLEESDQRRLVIPLDIVAKLLVTKA